MTLVDNHLRTQAVARALGLSVSTVKRWVDLGKICAVRTAGKHRLIPRSEAIRMAQELGRDPTPLRKVAGIAAGDSLPIDESVCNQLCHLLNGGQADPAKRLIQAIYSSGCGGANLADHVVRPVMASIGHAWMEGTLDVFQEHQASHIMASAILEIIDRVCGEQPEGGPLALGATVEGDPYVLSSLLAELVLREMRFCVRNLGVNLPLRSLASATVLYRPTLVFLSINFLRDRDQFVRDYLSFYETASRMGAAVIVGGEALDTELRSQLIYSAFGDRMIHMAEFARRFALKKGVPGAISDSSSRSVRRGQGRARSERQQSL
ncbi:MAG TPA: excisionase family DNA-binding protein [Isosphaeraceae bacterium]|nr:excisionase family DNA-binding protein [Isosphaeraceae bacterium]